MSGLDYCCTLGMSSLETRVDLSGHYKRVAQNEFFRGMNISCLMRVIFYEIACIKIFKFCTKDLK